MVRYYEINEKRWENSELLEYKFKKVKSLKKKKRNKLKSVEPKEQVAQKSML